MCNAACYKHTTQVLPSSNLGLRLVIYLVSIFNTVIREIFVYENIHVLNIRVNKFSRVPHKNILTRKFVKLKLLCTYR